MPKSSLKLLALAEQYPNIYIKQLDVTDSEENIQAALKDFRKVDILINNAGMGIVGVAESFSVPQIQCIARSCKAHKCCITLNERAKFWANLDY